MRMASGRWGGLSPGEGGWAGFEAKVERSNSRDMMQAKASCQRLEEDQCIIVEKATLVLCAQLAGRERRFRWRGFFYFADDSLRTEHCPRRDGKHSTSSSSSSFSSSSSNIVRQTAEHGGLGMLVERAPRSQRQTTSFQHTVSLRHRTNVCCSRLRMAPINPPSSEPSSGLLVHHSPRRCVWWSFLPGLRSLETAPNTTVGLHCLFTPNCEVGYATTVSILICPSPGCRQPAQDASKMQLV